MRKVSITQEEINKGDGNFNDYMGYVRDRLSAKFVEPRNSLFAAIDLISNDGFTIDLGSEPDDAGLAVANWMSNFYGDRENVSYCFPHIAYQINGVIYQLRMPIVREEKIPLLEAVIGMTEEAAARISKNKLIKLQSEYNEFYSIFYDISRLDTTTIIHLESAAERLLAGAAHYALSRWENLHFIERAMKEVLEPKGVKLTGSNGHDIRGALHREWITAGLSDLPSDYLDQVMCSPSIRYQRAPHPFLTAINAHHAAIRLGVLIVREIPEELNIIDNLNIKTADLIREGPLAIARVYKALALKSDAWQPVQLTLDSYSKL